MNSASQCVVLHLPYIIFDLEASWVPNIRSITLGLPFTTTKILKCLANMPRLEKARLCAWFPDFLPNSTPTVEPVRISHPLLTDLHMEHYYSVAADVLRRIDANAECSYSIYTIEDAITGDAQREVFSGCLARQINRFTEQELKVFIFDKSITVNLYGGSAKPSYIHNHAMDLSKVPEPDIRRYVSHFYEGNSTFNTVNNVNLDIKVPNQDDIQQIFDSVAQFLLAFPSVKTLELSQQSLFLVTKICRPNGQFVNEQLFPTLEKLIFGRSDPVFTFPVQPLLTSFLEQRRSCGRPIKELAL